MRERGVVNKTRPHCYVLFCNGTHTHSEPPPTSSSFSQPSSTPYRPSPDIIPPVGPGWNDPPLQFQRTQHGAAATGEEGGRGLPCRCVLEM